MEATIEEVIPKRKGGPQRTTNRLKPDGSYDNKPTDPYYFRDYYRNKLSTKCACEVCGKDIVKIKMHKHQQTNKCQLIGLQKKLNPEINFRV